MLCKTIKELERDISLNKQRLVLLWLFQVACLSWQQSSGMHSICIETVAHPDLEFNEGRQVTGDGFPGGTGPGPLPYIHHW